MIKNRFYREESRRIKEKNYVYYGAIGIAWTLNIIIMCCQYKYTQNIGTLKLYCFVQFFGTLELMSRLSENVFFVKELGEKRSRLKKYNCVPVLQKQCLSAYMLIMARYLMLFMIGFLVLYFVTARLTHTALPMGDTIKELLIFVLVSAIGYIWFTVPRLIKNRK